MADETKTKEKEPTEPTSKVFQAPQVTVMRSQINFANYNPRKISEKARKLLKQNLKTRGLMGGVVFNRTTGNLISGHQRVGIIDEVNRYNPDTKENDYPIRVELVEMDEKTEKEQNLFMNNKQVQGEFDDDMLRQVLQGIDYTAAGLEEFDMQMLGLGDQTVEEVVYQPWNRAQQVGENLADGEERSIEQAFLAKVDEETRNTPEQRNIDRSIEFAFDTPENQIARHNEMDKIKERINNTASRFKDHGTLSYVVVSFKGVSEKEEFMHSIGLDPFDKYIDGEKLTHFIEFGEYPDEEDDDETDSEPETASSDEEPETDEPQNE